MALVIDEEHFSRLLERLKLNGIRNRLDALLDEAAKEAGYNTPIRYTVNAINATHKKDRKNAQ